ncbi:MAG: hypothetical protein E4G96_09775, partial [Chrysiogenales bacterium]
MPNDSENRSKDKGKGTLLTIPDGVRKNLPDTFDINGIGTIDLREAESIANEGVLFLTESDLVEGLEDFDLIPLKEVEKPREKPVKPADSDKSVVERGRDEKDSERPHTPEGRGPDIETEPEAELNPIDEYDDGREWVPIEQLDVIDEKGRKWTPLERLIDDEAVKVMPVIEETQNEVPAEPSEITSVDETGSKRAIERNDRGGIEPERGKETGDSAIDEDRPEKKIPRLEGYVESDDEYVIWDMPESDTVLGEPRLESQKHKEKTPSAVKGEERGGEKIIPASSSIDAPPQSGGVREVSGREPGESLMHVGKGSRQDKDVVPPVGVAPGDLGLRIPVYESEEPRVHFIDDRTGVSDEERDFSVEGELEKVTRGIFQFEEGAGYTLSESDAREDRDRIAYIAREFEPAYEELFVDLDYKYRDEEIDYIHAAIVEEDYSDYIREIDEFFGTRSGMAVPAAVELLGLTTDEFDTIEDM